MLQRKSWGPVPLLVLRSPQAGCCMSDSLVVAFAAGNDFSPEPCSANSHLTSAVEVGTGFSQNPRIPEVGRCCGDCVIQHTAQSRMPGRAGCPGLCLFGFGLQGMETPQPVGNLCRCLVTLTVKLSWCSEGSSHFAVVPIALVLSLGTTGKTLSLPSLYLSLDVCKYLDDFAPTFPGWTVSALSAF